MWGQLWEIGQNSARELGVAAIQAVAASAERSVTQRGLPPVRRAELDLPLLSAKLAVLAYAESEDEARCGLNAMGFDLLWFQHSPPQALDGQLQWYLARGPAPPSTCGGGAATDALVLAFRGTSSAVDWMRDLYVAPEQHGANSFHGGFLRGVRDDAQLHAQLRSYVRGSAPLFVVGHSLGGALALTLVGAGLLPAAPTFSGSVTVVGLGSPAVFYDAVHPGGGADTARLMLVVNDADVVPRLLGSPLSLSRGLLRGGGGAGREEIVGTFERYRHAPQLELVLLRGGSALAVRSPAERDAVLHLHEALSPSAVQHHMQGEYVANLEAAVRSATA